MTSQDLISGKMEQIRKLFQQSKELAAQQDDMKILSVHLESIEPEFRAIAYEAVSMALALKDFTTGTLDLWHLLIQGTTDIYSPDIHTGLGWAIAQENKSLISILRSIDPFMHYRVLDGFGYYEGMFRPRQSISQQKIPQEFKGIDLQSYDQGLGRSIWYVTSGNPVKAVEIIHKFSSARQPDLWRGLGIAATYLGACDEAVLYLLFSSAQAQQVQLSTGAALSARARIQSQTLSADQELACRLWCGLSAPDAKSFIENSQPPATGNPEDYYAKWVSCIGQQLVSSGLINSGILK